MYIENPDEEQNKNQSSSSPSVGAGGGGASVGTGGTSTGGNPSTIQPIQTNQPNQSFANVQDYLKANQPQGEDLGNKFISNISPNLTQSKSAIDTSAQNVQNAITAGTVNTNPDLINTALSNPTAITKDQDQLAEFQKEYNAQYTGPTSFESSDQYAPASNAANQAAQFGQELGTTGGREQLLQDQFGVYGQGNKGLDQTLLQNSSAYSNIPILAQGFNSVQDYLKAAAANTNTTAANAAATTANTKTAATQPFTNNVSNFQNTINSEVQQAQKAATELGSPIQKDLASGNGPALAKDLKIAGVSPENIQSIAQYLSTLNKEYNQTPDLSNYYLSNPLTDITATNVATPEEYEKAAAYKTLTGVDYGGILNPANAAQAGTANLNPKVDASGLVNYLQGNLKQRDTETIDNAPGISPTTSLDTIEQVLRAANRSGINSDKVTSYRNTYFSRTGKQPGDLV